MVSSFHKFERIIEIFPPVTDGKVPLKTHTLKPKPTV